MMAGFAESVRVKSEADALRQRVSADTAWRVAEARAEQAVEVRNIGKASLEGDVGNRAFVVACFRQHRESPLQAQFGDARGEGCSGLLQQPLQIARGNAHLACDRDDAESGSQKRAAI